MENMVDSKQEKSVTHQIKVYGVSYKHMNMEIKPEMIQTGKIIKIENRKYRILSIIDEKGKPSAVNVVKVEKR